MRIYDDLNIKEETITIPYKLNPEEYFIKKFKQDGFNCIKTTSYNKYEISNKSLIDFLEKVEKKGIPDLVVFNNNEFFFVEVKDVTDTIKKSQIEWMQNNPHIKVVVYYLKQRVNIKSSDDLLNKKEKILLDIKRKTDIRTIKPEFGIILDVLEGISPINKTDLLEEVNEATNEIYGCELFTYKQLYDNLQLLIEHGAVNNDYVTKRVSINPIYISQKNMPISNYCVYLFTISAILLIISIPTGIYIKYTFTIFIANIIFLLSQYYGKKRFDFSFLKSIKF